MNARQTYSRSDSAHDLGFLYSRYVTDLVHFTHLYNLPGILREGLLPPAVLEQMNVQYTGTDNLRLDGRNAVNLSITNPNIKMFYGKKKELKASHYFVVLTLDPALLSDVEGSYEFRRGNAASWDSQPCKVEDLFSGDRPQYFEPSWTTDNQAEIRVWGRIDPRRIKTIQFPSDYYTVYRHGPSERPWPDYLAESARELGLQLEVMLCDRYFHYYKSPIGKQYEQRRCFECRVVHPQAGTRLAKANINVHDPAAANQQTELSDRIAQGSDAIQRAANNLVERTKELSKTMSRLETKVDDASRVTATAKGEATKAERLHRKADSLLEATQESVRSIEASIAEMQASCDSLARNADATARSEAALLERIEALESTIGRIDRNTQKGFGKERGKHWQQ